MRGSPETEFLNSEEVATGCEWEMFKENVRPLKRGRNVNMLNNALRSHSKPRHFNSLLQTQTQRKLFEAIEEYQGDDPLRPWLDCIKWVQEAFPTGGDSSRLILIYEQCVRTFWHEDRYKNDLRYLKIWLEYAENCADAEVIYNFLEVNKIGQIHSVYYIAHALHMEGKLKIQLADNLFNRGLTMNAQPREILEVAYRKFLARTMRKPQGVADEVHTDIWHPVRCFGSDISSSENTLGRRQTSVSTTLCKYFKGDGGQRVPLSIYKDQNNDCSSSDELDSRNVELGQWNSLASHVERNKENSAVPAKWTSLKIPQRSEHRAGVSATPVIDVLVDADYLEHQPTISKLQNSSNSESIEGNMTDLEWHRESELLRKSPLRKFPTSSLPR
ncbi:hypothetical protein Droror1_Dr00004379 [Drosera rotundifolia]